MTSLTTGTTAHRPMLRRKTGWAKIAGLFAFWRSRSALADLDDALLKDIGLTHGDVREELRRSSWDVPTAWRL